MPAALGLFLREMGIGAAVPGTPSIGQTLRRRGSLWSVTGVDGERVVTIYVEAADRTSPVSRPMSPAREDVSR